MTIPGAEIYAFILISGIEGILFVSIGDLFGLNSAFKIIAMISTVVLSFMVYLVQKSDHSKKRLFNTP